MTRRSRITGRFKAGRCDLFRAATKSAPHVRGNQTRKARQHAKVWAVVAKLRQECGL